MKPRLGRRCTGNISHGIYNSQCTSVKPISALMDNILKYLLNSTVIIFLGKHKTFSSAICFIGVLEELSTSLGFQSMLK